MRLTWIRALIVFLGAIVGYVAGAMSVGGVVAPGAGAMIGVGVFGLAVVAEWWLSLYSPGGIAGGFVGLILGLLAARLLEAPLTALPVPRHRQASTPHPKALPQQISHAYVSFHGLLPGFLF